jgi:hypothetical protein
MSTRHDKAPAPDNASAAPPSDSAATEPTLAALSASQVMGAGGTVAASMPWKTTAEGKTVFRRGGPLILWWLWVAFALFNFLDVAVQDHDYFSFELTAGLLAVTAVVYACTLRPRVVADNDAVSVYNPYRDHLVRWGAVNGVQLGDSVEITCARPGPGKDKIIYCWALYSGRRSRVRTQVRAERHEARVTSRTTAEISALRRPDPVNLVAAELRRRSTAAQQRGVPQAMLESRWAWLPVAYLLASAATLLALVLAR